MNKKRIFISGPMSGYPWWNYPQFDIWENFFVRNGFEVVNPANIGRKFGPEKVDADPILYKEMEAEIQAAERTCDAIFLLKGWEDSKGVRLELKTAIEMKLPIILEGSPSVKEKLKALKGMVQL